MPDDLLTRITAHLATLPTDHTPGPWKARVSTTFDERAATDIQAWQPGSGDHAVATLDDEEDDSTLAPVQEANVRLIASAPDTAALLRECAGELERHEEPDSSRHLCDCSALQDARAESERCQSAVLKIRRALGLGRDSAADLVEVIAAMRARLQALLDAERGVRGPEGWEYRPHGRIWLRDPINVEPWKDGWAWWQITHPSVVHSGFNFALEAMEAADAARKADHAH